MSSMALGTRLMTSRSAFQPQALSHLENGFWRSPESCTVDPGVHHLKVRQAVAIERKPVSLADTHTGVRVTG
jgi:hypothetical protein